ncbi:hypothetical protein BH09PSE4_BH09PSE4_17100 [soil metagenome]
MSAARGLLRIASQRSPYLRAGLGWPTREPVEVDIRALDGDRLLELLGDPVLTVTIGQDNGSFGPLPELPDDLTAAHFQMMIDAMAEELPPIDAPMTAVVVGEVVAIDEKLKAAGYSSLDQLLGAHDALAKASDDLAERLKGAGMASVEDLFADHATLRMRNQAQADQILDLSEKLTEAGASLATANGEIATLKSEVAALKAAKPAETGAKPHKPTKQPAAADKA